MSGPLQRVLVTIAFTIGLGACASLQSKGPAEWDGLEKRDVKGVGLVYVRPNVQFPPYKNVIIEPVHVEFSKNWDPNSSRDTSRRIDADDIQKIKAALAGWVRDGFSDELKKGGYAITDTAGDDTLRVSPAIVNLYITAPDIASSGRSKTYTTDAGSMTLVMEIRDAPTDQLLARVVDARRAGSVGGQMQWANSVTNRADAQRIIAGWAQQFRAGLDRLKNPTQTTQTN